MNRNDFTGYINGRMSAGEADIPGIRELINLYPWFHSAHLVLLKALKESSDVRFDSQLHESAIYVADRSMLYSYLYIAAPGVQKPEPALPAEPVSEPMTVLVPAAAENVPAETTPPEETLTETAESPVENVISIEHEAGEKAGVPHAEPVKEKEHAQSDTDFSTRTREELISEIEARLRELAAVAVPEGADQTKTISTESVVQETPGADVRLAEGIAEEPPAGSMSESDREDAARLTEETPHEVIETEPAENSMPEQPPVLEIEPETVLKEETPEEAAEPFKEADDDLLELAGDDFSDETDEYIIDVNALKSSAQESLTQADLIDRFIETSPRIQRMEPTKDENVVDLSVDSVETKDTFITETLARIYISQGYYSKAINIYEKLALQYPEKSAYFASRIEKIKDLIK